MRLKINIKKVKRCVATFLITMVAATEMTQHTDMKYLENIFAAENVETVTNDEETLFDEVLQTFPKSYRSYIKKLHELHPKWNFVPFETGLDWDTVIKNEMFLTRNLVPDGLMTLGGVDDKWYKTPTSWKDIKTPGAFDWTGNAWVQYSGGGWVQASEKAVEYIMDPRNWLTENNIFMFEQLSYNSKYQTVSVLKKMMKDTFMDCEYATVGGSGKKTYAEVLKEAAVENNVSPVLLCARLIQEKGRGVYSESKGKYVMDDLLAGGIATDDNGKTFRKATSSDEVVYYNYFNIGAAGLTYDDVINNGGREAMEAGWTSQYKSILGGASKLADSKINIGQDTLYFQKFSVVDEVYLYWNQYMQNLLAPVNEGFTTMKSYSENGMLDAAFTFRIPVYENMPTNPCERPAQTDNTGNPNYKLKSLSVTAIEEFSGNTSKLEITPSFGRDELKYTATVPYKVTGIKVSAKAIAPTSVVSGTGDIELKVGTNEINIKCKSEYGTSRTYKLIITRKAGSTYLTKIKPSAGALDTEFFKGTFSYIFYVNNSVKNMTLYFTRESEVALVETVFGGKTTVTTGNKTAALELKEGKNNIYLKVYPSPKDKSDVSIYKISVVRYTKLSFDKKKLKTNGEYIKGFAIGDTVKKAMSRMSVTGGRIKIINSQGESKAEAERICTGDKVIVYDANGYKYKVYKIVIYGDINCDGNVDLLDYQLLKDCYLGDIKLEGTKLEAANISGKTVKITLADVSALKKYIWEGAKYEQAK